MPWSVRGLSVIFGSALALAACGPATAPLTPAGASPLVTAGAAPSAIPAITLAVACQSPARPTAPVDEGPFFKAGSPLRTSLVDSGVAGTRLMLTGFIVSRSCQPVVGALLDFWQADASGTYDNVGYRLRGHQASDALGRYQLETVVPGEYPGRTPHIHVKVQAPGRAVLTSQLYFPDAARNASDGLFRPELVMRVDRSGDALAARFDFVVDVP